MRDGEAKTNAGRSAALILTITSLGLLTILVVGAIARWWPLAFDPESMALSLTMILFLALGPLILWRANGNRVGWAFSGIGLGMMLAAVSGALADSGLILFHAIGGAAWLGWIAALGTLLLWFPTGRVPSRRWIWLQWLGFLIIGLTVFTSLFSEQICIESSDGVCALWVDNPIGIPVVPNSEYGWISGPLFLTLPFFFLGALLSSFVRYRRAETVERLQLKWFLLACFSFVAALISELVLELFGILDPPVVISVWIDVSMLAIPIAATLAILRYRLYEIDRIISRTVSYAIVIVLLAVVYAVGLTALTSLLDTNSPLAVAGSTLAAAALFNPLRRRVQHGVDHRFNRTRYDAERVMTGFTGSLRDEVDPDSVVTGWVSVVTDTMHPASAGVWVRQGSS